MNDEFWELIDETIEKGDPVDDLIPYDISDLCESDRIKLLSIMITYGTDPRRVAVCRRKIIENASRRNSI